MDYMMSFRLVKDQSFIDFIYHKICSAILLWHDHLTMQETKELHIFFLVINSQYTISKTEEQS